ncbi:glycoside hydrolase family 10 protein [Cohnella nanjingensis]|uniref:Family 10 glycosylhydrolase n=1 Tax=Cohnella nanjingensis TaxID=1387779 RepID=A0A7X0RVL8_9BACL|nr:family 10 glycosylhydrolase [Cohnella nanjingensis]MBB6673306.1 family 10 glycosylhydrolase [Cohnella nanjingensis]
MKRLPGRLVLYVMAIVLSVGTLGIGAGKTALAAESIKAIAPDGSEIVITAVNRPVAAVNDMILYTRDNSGKQTDSNEWSTAAVVDDVEGKYIVSAIADKKGAVDIPSNGFVLFGNAASGQWVLDHLKAGDEVIVSGYTLPQPVIGPSLLLEDGSSYPVDALDEDRQPSLTVIYTHAYGEKTKPFDTDTVEYIVAGDVVVSRNTNGSAGTVIPGSGYVLSAAASGPLGMLEIGQGLRAFNLDIRILPARYAEIGQLPVGIDKLGGSRDLGQVVLYQPSYGSSTRTNPWGMEITVEGERVTRIVAIAPDPSRPGSYLDNDSPIPSNGFVLSIQSASPFYNQLNGKVAVGDSVKLVLDSLVYQAGKIGYDAFNPRTREDNPAGWDDANNVPFPGYRGLDQIIVYDRTYGERSGTNPWGNEIVVDARGLVISNGGNNNAIPEGGFVVSGVGTTAAWLASRVPIGATVTVDRAKKRVVVIFTPSSYLDKASIGIEQAERGIQASKARFLDVPYAQMAQQIAEAKAVMAQVQAKLEQGDQEGLLAMLNEMDRRVSDLAFMNYESRKVETRGLWLRPKETNLAQVKEHLDRIQATRINAIYLETWWDGYASYPSKQPDTALNPIYQGFDVLQAYIEEGSKRGIEIHAWVENFYVGQGHTSPVYDNHPDWWMISRKGDPYADLGNTKDYFLNPALPEARDYVLSIYKELVSKYDVAGIHLDFTRYPDSGDYTNDFSYDPYTRGLFKDRYGTDPIDLHPGDVLWDEWTRFRIDVINTFVDRIAHEVMPLRPGMKLTAAVWPNFELAPKTVLQEVKNWVDKNYMDQIFHMSYVPDTTLIAADAKRSLDLMGDKGLVASGVGTFINLTKQVLADQIDQVNRLGVAGTALFEFESLFNNGYDHELKLGLYRNEAIVPDYATTLPVYTMLEDVVRKMNEIYVPFGGMSSVDAKAIADDIRKETKKLQPRERWNHGKVVSLKSHLSKIVSDVQGRSSIQAEVKNRILTDLQACDHLLDIYLTKEGKSGQ